MKTWRCAGTALGAVSLLFAAGCSGTPTGTVAGTFATSGGPHRFPDHLLSGTVVLVGYAGERVTVKVVDGHFTVVVPAGTYRATGHTASVSGEECSANTPVTVRRGQRATTVVACQIK